MAPAPKKSPRREDSLSRERVIDAAIELLDRSGESGLTFRLLSERLATGPGALYGHIANKGDLVTAACDTLVARTIAASASGPSPQATLRNLAAALFDTIDAHPWVGMALTRAAGQLPMVRIFEGIGQQVRALGVPPQRQWPTASALLGYVIGVGSQNAASSLHAHTVGADRSTFLGEVSDTWSRLDPAAFPFAHSMAEALRGHDDRADFLEGLDLILAGLGSPRRRRFAAGA